MRRIAGAATALWLMGCQAQSEGLQPGQWEIVTEVVSVMGVTPRHGGPVSPPLTIRHCVTPQQALRPDANFITGNDADSGCAYQDFSMERGRLRGTIQCNDGAVAMRTTISGEYRPTSFEITADGEATQGQMKVPVESRSRGRRTGDC